MNSQREDEGMADLSLGDQQMWIGGHWVDALGGLVDKSVSPATGEMIGTFPRGGREDAQAAISAAQKAADGLLWATAPQRSAMCHRVADALEASQTELAVALTLDQGKPISEAEMEAKACSHFFRQAAEDILRLHGQTLHSADPGKRILTFYQARGPYAVITPWNFPYNIPSEYLSANLAAGNPVVWVPAPTTSACGLAFARALEAAELPPGAINVVTGAGPIVGDELVVNDGVIGVCFTGSPVTGKTIATRGAGKPMLLELGGNGPVVVLDDADVEHAADGVCFSAYFNAGQACSATERVIVTEEIHDRLVEAVLDRTKSVRLGDPFDRSTTMGPLNNCATAEKMDRHIADAVGQGAVVHAGGGRADGFPTDLYYEPTVMTGVSAKMEVHNEESFGPIVPFTKVADMEDAVRVANDNTLGLVSSVYTKNMAAAFYVGERIRTGVVNINETPDYWESHAPYGGRAGTNSGIGRLGGANTLGEVMDIRNMTIDLNKGGL